VKKIFLAAVLSLLPLHGAEARVLHQERSQYRDIVVTEDNSQRCLQFVGPAALGRESCVYLNDKSRLVFNYTKMMMGALFIQPAPRDILIVGLGGGTLPSALREILPDATITVVEIDPAVVRISREYFDFAVSPTMKVVTSDGRVFVNDSARKGRKYDLVMLDAFELNYIPDHMMTKEFLTSVKSILKPSGVLAANTFSSSALYDNESVTYASVFKTFFNAKSSNRIIFASLGALPNSAQMTANARPLAGIYQVMGIDQAALIGMMREDADWNSRARVLTDQYSPANLLNHLGDRRLR
jgi:spermidine synthase